MASYTNTNFLPNLEEFAYFTGLTGFKWTVLSWKKVMSVHQSEFSNTVFESVELWGCYLMFLKKRNKKADRSQIESPKVETFWLDGKIYSSNIALSKAILSFEPKIKCCSNNNMAL